MTSVVPIWSPTHLTVVVQRQLEALDAWNMVRQQRERLLLGASTSREAHLDAARRVDVLRRVHAAVVERADSFLAHQPGPLELETSPRAVVAHHHEWFIDKLTGALQDAGVRVVGATDNGADALGIAVAEQPDVLIAGDPLAMMTAPELLADVALFAPYTARAAHVPYGDAVGGMLDAGAHSVFTRQVPPAEVAAGVVQLLGERLADEQQ